MHASTFALYYTDSDWNTHRNSGCCRDWKKDAALLLVW